jgi:ribosome modulation factor
VSVPEKLQQQFDRNASTWQEGAKAARAGLPMTACPYPLLDYAFVTWTNGWAFAAHNKAKEDDEL